LKNLWKWDGFCFLNHYTFSQNQFLGFICRHRSDRGGATLKQNTVIRASRLFVLCINLVFGGKYMEFRIFFSFQNSISIRTFEVDHQSDSLHNAVVKPKNILENTCMQKPLALLTKPLYFPNMKYLK
jgi:hypothetical protein